MRYDDIDESQFTPDFYFLGTHGTGSLSFLYYLSWIGCPSSNNESDYTDGKKSPIFFPVPKTSSIFARGISVDRFFLDKPLDYYAAKVIQLIRDPVDLLTSFTNWKISNAVMCGRSPININEVEILNNSTRLDYIISNFILTIMFTSMRKCINSCKSALVIDTSELFPDKCKTTMHNVAKYLGGRYHNILDTICQISYNSFSNRIWIWQQPKCFICDQYLSDIKVYPTKLHDSFANHWQRAKILDIFMHNGEEYTVSMPDKVFYEIEKVPNKNIWNEKKRECMRDSIDILLAHHELSERLYKKYAVTTEDIIALIRSNPRFHTRFMRLMEHEISLPLKEAPDKVEHWTHFHAL